jgi:hypothetical protein
MIPSSDDKGRPVFPGEVHAPLRLPSGGIGIANYMGPGTHVVERVRRGDPPRTASDKVAMAHDIRYSLAPNKGRAADKKMIAKLNAIQKKKQDRSFNINMGKRPIQAKMALENRGLLSKTRFTDGAPLNASDRNLLQSKLDMLEQEGFGVPPGRKLAMSINDGPILPKKNKKKRKATAALQAGSGTKFQRGGGSGFQRGGASGLVSKLAKHIPLIAASAGLKKGKFMKTIGGPVKFVRSVIDDAVKTPLALMNKVAAKLVNAMFSGVIGDIKSKLGQSGSGMSLKLPDNKKKQLINKIVKGFRSIHDMQGSGSMQIGAGFWSDVGNFFKKAVKAVLPIVAPIAATAVGGPAAGAIAGPLAGAIAGEL